MTSSRILITGTTGFIGAHLSRVLRARHFEVHTLNRRPPVDATHLDHVTAFSDEKKVAEILDQIRPDIVIHLASRARPNRNLYEFDAQIEDSVRPAINLARALSGNIQLAIFVGSCEEYGNGPTPFREEQRLRSMSPYGWAKIAAYDATQLILNQRQIPACWVRPFLTFGPGQDTEQLIPSLIRACLADEEIPLSPGGQTRDFLYIEDLCAMFVKIIDNPSLARGETLNLCSSEPRTVRAVAESIRELSGAGKLKFGALPYRLNEAMSFFGANEKYQAKYGKPVLTNFDFAIRKTIESIQMKESSL